MSFTVTHYKNGQPVEVKMSIWDAFKGVPGPKPRRPRCPCCKLEHHPDNSGDSKKASADINRNKATKMTHNNGKSNDESQNQANNHSTSEKEDYSNEDNAKIIEMKGENATWAKILEAIGKTSKSQLQAHWKMIDPAKAGNSNAAEKGEIEGKQDKKAKGEKGGTQGKKTQNVKPSDTTKPHNDLKALANQYDKQKWVTVASKHFDLTGQRITPEQARKMVAG